MRSSLLCVTVAAMFTVVALAGCAGDDGGKGGADGTGVDRENFDLQAGKGAIAGLLVDDRFRPIQLTDDPTSPFQARGFVLLQETGEQVQTNENGEFTFVDLEPGTYKVRVSASGHEATPQEATVEAGVFAEQTVIARRVINVEGTVLTQEHAMFIACAADYVANGGNLPCDLDLSSDSYSSAFSSDYTDFDNVTFMITEMKANQEKRWEIQIRGSDARYAAAIEEGDYVRLLLQNDTENDHHWDNPGYAYGPWQNNASFSTIVFIDHDGREEIQGVWPDNPGAPTWFTPCCGVGFSLGVSAKFLQSVFIGEPEVDIETYCVLC